MASLPGHAVAAIAIGAAFATPAAAAALGPPRGPGRARGMPFAWWAIGVALACLPDLDVLAFRLGIPYDAPLGHRGLSHSLFIAAALGTTAGLLLALRPRWAPLRGRLCVHFALTGASHGLLDALTDGGRGVALLAPFTFARYFFPVRPIAVSPIGTHGYSPERVISVVRTELLWIGVPAMLLILALAAMRKPSPSRG